MNLNDAIFSRRSTRAFKDYNISDKELEELIEAGAYAPSWSNTQCWNYIIIKDKELIKKTTELYSETNPAKKGSLSASVLIVGCIKKKTAGYRGEEKRTSLDGWDMFDLGLSVQNISLKAHDMGLGSVIVGSLNHNELNKLLSIPEEFTSVVVLPIGKPEDKELGKKAPKRKPENEFLFLNKFNNKFE